MALPTCECVKGLPIGEQLAAIYCATYTLAAGDVDGPYLLKSANLSDVADPDVARGNISAAKSGVNTDITSLGGVLNIGVGGVTPTAATYPKVVARKSGNQTLTVGGTVAITGFTEIQDDAAIFDPTTGEITIPANGGGTWFVGLSNVDFENGTTARIINHIYVNGVDVLQLTNKPYTTGEVNTVNGGMLLPFSAGDVITWRVTQIGGAAWDMVAFSQGNYWFTLRVF